MSTESIWGNVEHVEASQDNPLVHPRVLDLPDEVGRSLVFASFADVPNARALFGALRPAIEAAWLAELSSAAVAESGPEPVGELALFCFEDVPTDAGEAVGAFGFAAADLDARSLTRLPMLRAEASRMELPVPERPTQLFRAQVRYANSGLGDMSAVAGELFGAEPGRLARALVAACKGDLPGLDANLAGLDALETMLFTSDADVVRGVTPPTFRAFADLVGVCLVRDLGLEVGWAPPETDEHGVTASPLLRVVPKGRGPVMFPIGLELLRRCVMPRREGEEIAPLSRWLRDCFPADPTST